MIYFIPTPIGNLEDISVRSLNLLAKISHIFCEDTRVTKQLIKLLEQKHNIPFSQKIYTSFHSHNETQVINSLDIQSLHVNDFIFVSDAGMPCISDPGAKMVEFCQQNDIKYEVLPGANALMLAYASCGFLDTEFSFFGFLPHKNKDEILQNILNNPLNSIIYEAPHRILQLAKQISTIDENRKVFFIKEATKKFQKSFFGTAKQVYELIKNTNQKGEWAVVIEKNTTKKNIQSLHVSDILPLEIKPKIKAKLLAKLSGDDVEFWYKTLSDKKV